MKPCLIDSDILSLFFRDHPKVVLNFDKYLHEYKKINFSIVTYYEIVSGLKHKDGYKKLSSFLEFAKCHTILSLSEHSVMISGDIYADLRKKGQPIDDIDILIADIAISNNLIIVTHNRKHFERIDNLELEDWSV